MRIEAVILAQTAMDKGVQLMNVSFFQPLQSGGGIDGAAQSGADLKTPPTSTFFTTLEERRLLLPHGAIGCNTKGRVLAQIATGGRAPSTAVSLFNEGDQYGDTLTREFKINFEAGGGTETGPVWSNPVQCGVRL